MVQWNSLPAKLYLEKRVQFAIVPILTISKKWYIGLVYVENKVKLTSVPGKTGTIDYCTHTNKSSAREKVVHCTRYLVNMVVPGK